MTSMHDQEIERRKHLLVTSLQVSVPLLVHQARNVEQSIGDVEFARVIDRWRKNGIDQIAHHGDVLQFRVKNQTAKAFNGLAQGIAALSLHSGGVNFCGMLWCAVHHIGGSPVDDRCCPECLEEEKIQ